MSEDCKRCGWCCENLPIPLTFSDLTKWLAHNRLDLLKEVSFVDNYPTKGEGAFYIIKTVLNPKQACPFHQNQSCEIYTIKPKVCEDFPFGKKQYKACALSKSLSPNKEREAQIQQTQFEDFQKAFLKRERLLKVITWARE